MSNKKIEDVSNNLHFNGQYSRLVKILIQARKDSRQSQGEVAAWVNTNRLRVIKFEKCENFDFELLLLLCEKFSITVDLFFELN